MWFQRILVLYILSLRITKSSQDWDFLLFSQCWPPTVCRIWMESDPSHTCTLPESHDAWSIHGIWPTCEGSLGPEFCNKTWVFDPKQIKPVEARLEQAWINVENGTITYDFWSHEWSKHGTCAASVETLNSQLKYFSQGLEWLQKYTMKNILLEANIIPSDTKRYPFKVFYNAIKKKLGVDANINCFYDKGNQYLREIRICFTKSLEIIDCKNEFVKKLFIRSGDSFTSNCNSSRIIYSETVPPN